MVARRQLVKGAAWALPVVVVGAPAPAMALSGCALDLAWATAGWVTKPSSGSFTSGTCGSAQPEGSGKWWQWCDSTTSSSYVYTREVTFNAVAGKRYTFSIATEANPGNPTPNSNATLVLAIDGAQEWAGYTQTSPGGKNAHLLISSPSWTNQPWTFVWTPTTTGTHTLTLRWTAAQKSATRGSTDDIGISAPVATCV